MDKFDANHLEIKKVTEELAMKIGAISAKGSKMDELGNKTEKLSMILPGLRKIAMVVGIS